MVTRQSHSLASLGWLVILAGLLSYATPEARGEEKSAAELARENAELRQRLNELKTLEEDLMAKRVFEKARSYLFSWITISGLLLTVSGIIGIKAAYDYVTTLVARKLDAITQEQLQKSVEDEGRKLIAVIVDKQTIELDAYAKRKIEQMVLASRPIKSLTAATGSPLPPSLDLTGDIKVVRDSGNEGSVVGHALATALDYLILKATGETVRTSARHIYYLARLEGGLAVEADTGALIKDGIKSLTNTGAVEESVWRYRAGEFGKSPPAGVESARKHKIAEPEPVTSLDDLRRALSSGRAVVAGISMFHSSTADQVIKTGVLRLPGAKDNVIGGHAVCVVGYDDDQRRLKFVNSWGKSWGSHGFGFIPYEYFEKYSSDVWAFGLATA
jgi:hypothetical protein